MKKKTRIQTVVIAIVALLIGFFIGVIIDFPPAEGDDLVGAIGKVDRYRNVLVTEDDILLRNELAEDSTKRLQYENYLNYYYYQSMRTSSDLDRVLSLTAQQGNFENSNYLLVDALKNYRVYLEVARVDLLTAYTLVKSLDENEEIPLISILNKAQNAASRIRNKEDLLRDYMMVIKTSLLTNPGPERDRLEDAYDILKLNLLQASLITKNEPLLAYLVEDDLMNDREGLKVIFSQAGFNDFVQDQVAMDMEKLTDAVGDSENLKGIILTGTPELAATIRLDMEKLNVYYDVESLGVVMDAEKIGDGVYLSAPNLGFIILDAEKIGIAADAEKLGVYDSEQLGTIRSMEVMGDIILPK